MTAHITGKWAINSPIVITMPILLNPTTFPHLIDTIGSSENELIYIHTATGDIACDRAVSRAVSLASVILPTDPATSSFYHCAILLGVVE